MPRSRWWLIPGRGVIPALGIEGAAIASTLSIALGFIGMLLCFRHAEPDIVIHRTWRRPHLDIWRRIFVVGAPAAAELVLMFLSVSVIYLVIRDQGAEVQAGFGTGYRVLQVLLLPGPAVTLAAAPIAGQNFGAGNVERVREVFRTTAILSTIVMLLATIVAQWQPEGLLRMFDADGMSQSTATLFLQVMSWTLIAQGLVYTCAFLFQALGNTVPALWSAIARFVVFSVPALWLSQQSGFMPPRCGIC